ncbi:sedoheptulose 7-phosphate cyclase [Micromonospora inyonensis]|uniref:2-epi-5-epi-valiolone synthase n=1 Tax=Micromonospora inyonensis TaxID=47866 RepID=A0A1C6RL89_9ACTN|nr:sedoheptulose 7-phosphate cyclase [Micromonospora inyonensis]SCL17935.1 3-dehydroquinate synthase [Micromonospora inyonensis]
MPESGLPTGLRPEHSGPDPELERSEPIANWVMMDDEPRSYVIRRTANVFDTANPDLAAGGRLPGRRFVIVDSGVERHRRELDNYFAFHGLKAEFLFLPGGEACKEMDTALKIIDGFERFDLDRREEPVIAIGGGAVLDVAGFATSIYRRGVPLIRVPTTLLAYVDASIGIKTAINFMGRKNLVGTFTAPSAVLLDHTLLNSLPPAEVASGLGEILKLGLGCDAQIFTLLEQQVDALRRGALDTDDVQALLRRAIEVMLSELRPNLREANLARAVDLGHTFSQAFEMNVTSGPLRHGEAVALDLNLSAVISNRRGLLSSEQLGRFLRLSRRLGLPTAIPPIGPGRLWESVRERTRHRAGRQRIPLPPRIGECIFIDDLTPDELAAAADALE